MPYSIPSSTKILTLVTLPFLFIIVGILSVFEFAMVPGAGFPKWCWLVGDNLVKMAKNCMYNIKSAFLGQSSEWTWHKPIFWVVGDPHPVSPLPLLEETLRSVHFTVPPWRRGALFFLRAHMYTFSSLMIRKI